MNPWSPEKIKAVLFDFGGTLDSDGVPWKERFYPIYRSAGMNWDHKKFDQRFYASDDFLTEKKLKNAKYDAMLKKQISLVLKNDKIVKKISAQFKKDSFKYFKRNLPMIHRLSKRYKLGIVSNFYGNLPTLIKEIGYQPYFDVVIDSAWAGAIKPQAKIFYTALNRLKVQPQEAVFVGDSPHRDMAGAKAIGMPHIWLCPNKSKPCCRHDIVIKSLLELGRILV